MKLSKIKKILGPLAPQRNPKYVTGSRMISDPVIAVYIPSFR